MQLPLLMGGNQRRAGLGLPVIIAEEPVGFCASAGSTRGRAVLLRPVPRFLPRWVEPVQRTGSQSRG